MAERAGRSLRLRPSKFYQGLTEELVEFAEHEFELAQTAEDGSSIRDHLEAAARQLPPDRRPKELDDRDLPPGGGFLWQVFMELRSGAPLDGGISTADIEAWQRLYDTRLLPWEIAAIRRLDLTLRQVRARQAKGEAGNATGHRNSRHRG